MPGTPRRRGELSFAGQTLVEYQARQAAAAGAGAILILVEDVTPPLTGAIDRLGADGIKATLIRDMGTLARQLSAADDLLVIGDGAIIRPTDIALLGAGSDSRLLVLPSGPGTTQFERLDAEHMWAGAARLPVAMLIDIMDMLGDWDVVLTVIRTAVQKGVARQACDPADIFDGRLALATNQQIADAAEAALGRTGRVGAPQRDMDDWAVGQLAQAAVPATMRQGISAQAVRVAALAVSALGLIALIGGLPLPGLVLCYAGLVAGALALRLEQIMRLVVAQDARSLLPWYGALAAIFLAGYFHGGTGPLAWAGALVAPVLLLVQARVAGVDGQDGIPPALRFAPGVALLLLAAGALVGLTGVAAAIVALLALASLAGLLLGGHSSSGPGGRTGLAPN